MKDTIDFDYEEIKKSKDLRKYIEEKTIKLVS